MVCCGARSVLMENNFECFFFNFSFPGTKYCESILLPTDRALKKSLEATLFSAKNEIYLNDVDRLDLCCRSLHKCDAYKNAELNHTNELYVRHCECVHTFRKCLKSLNTSLSNDIAFVHSINITKCYAKDHPIIECVVFESHPNSTDFLSFMSRAERETFFKRCIRYQLDKSQPKKFQSFDLPSIFRELSDFACNYQHLSIIAFLFFSVFQVPQKL